MALLTFPPSESQSQQLKKHSPNSKRKKTKPKPPSSWDQIKNLLSCKQIEHNKIHDPSRTIYSSCCTFKDANTRLLHRSDNSPEGSTLLLAKKTTHGSSSRSLAAPRSVHLRKLSGCYECHAIVDPSRYPFPRTTICACSECGEVFPKLESLEHHQAVRHAVSELGAEDSSRNIVEIIFKSSWLKKDSPICKVCWNS